MKKIFFIAALAAITLVQKSFAQDSTQTQLYQSYIGIKNALVAGNANTASLKAGEFVKSINSIDTKIISEPTRSALLKDAAYIFENKDIKSQREHFGSFSSNMYSLAKAVKLTGNPVYYAYCPMKKAYWLSSDAAIKNPYYGNAMLTCGKVQEIIK